MTKQKYSQFTILLLICALSTGCGISRLTVWKDTFLLLPHEKAALVNEESAVIREGLSKEDYLVLCIEEINGEFQPVKHYQFEHTFSHKVWPEEVSMDRPLHISSVLIVDSISPGYGIAIKKKNEFKWRVLWLTTAHVKQIKKNEIFILPKYGELPYLN